MVPAKTQVESFAASVSTALGYSAQHPGTAKLADAIKDAPILPESDLTDSEYEKLWRFAVEAVVVGGEFRRDMFRNRINVLLLDRAHRGASRGAEMAFERVARRAKHENWLPPKCCQSHNGGSVHGAGLPVPHETHRANAVDDGSPSMLPEHKPVTYIGNELDNRLVGGEGGVM